MLQCFVPDQIWLCSYPVRLAGTRFEARMTVIRLSAGELILHSPCKIVPALAHEISALGPVKYIVAPGNFHHLHVASAQLYFPQAMTFICPGVERRNAQLKYDAVLEDKPPFAWSGVMEQVVMPPGRLMREVAMFHRAGRTLILVDLIENFTDATPRVSGALKFWFKSVMHMWNAPRPAPEYCLGWRDRPAAVHALQRILEWDFQRIVLAHGDLIEQDAHAIAERAWADILK